MSSSSYLLLPSLTPKTLTLTKSHLSYLPLSSSSLKFFTKPIFASSPFNAPKPLEPTPLSSRFVRNVAVSSEFEQEEDVATEQHFSPDLKLFVGNLPFNVDSSALANLFESAGTVEMVEVIYDKLTGRSRGFGFVTMSTVQEVEAAAQQFDGYEFQGRPLRVNFGPPPPRREESFRGPRVGGGGGSSNSDSSNRLYVGNLSWGVDDSALENLFSEQGKVMEARVVYDRETGRSRGFGFVTYSSPEEVNSAIESLDGVELNGRSIRVTVAESKPRRQF